MRDKKLICMKVGIYEHSTGILLPEGSKSGKYWKIKDDTQITAMLLR